MLGFRRPYRLAGLAKLLVMRFAAGARVDKTMTWSVIENTSFGHIIMFDEPEWLADVLMGAA
jgi:hypothetical protein